MKQKFMLNECKFCFKNYDPLGKGNLARIKKFSGLNRRKVRCDPIGFHKLLLFNFSHRNYHFTLH